MYKHLYVCSNLFHAHIFLPSLFVNFEGMVAMRHKVMGVVCFYLQALQKTAGQNVSYAFLCRFSCVFTLAVPHKLGSSCILSKHSLPYTNTSSSSSASCFSSSQIALQSNADLAQRL